MSSQYFSAYLSEIGKAPLLSREREVELSQVIQAGLTEKATPAERRASGEAQMELALHSLRLVVNLARRFQDRTLSLEDTTFAGNVGLMTAAARFDAARFKTRFSSFAYHWILQAIREATYRARVIRIPRRRIKTLQQIEDPQEVAFEAGLVRALALDVLKGHCLVISLDLPVHEGSDEKLGAALPSECQSPDEIISRQEELLKLAKAVAALPPREQHVVCARFGINGQSCQTLQQLADAYGVSREMVRKIQRVAVTRLRDSLEDPAPRSRNKHSTQSSKPLKQA